MSFHEISFLDLGNGIGQKIDGFRMEKIRNYNMQNVYSTKQLNAWLGQTVADFSDSRKMSSFINAFKMFREKTASSMSDSTFFSIANSVLLKGSEKFPILKSFKVESNQIILKDPTMETSKINSNEMNNSFQYFFIELFNLLSDLTGDLVPNFLQEKKNNLYQKNNDNKFEELVELGKVVASFESLEKSIPEVLASLSTSYAFKTLLIIAKEEHEEENFQCHIWHAPNVNEESIKRAIHHSQSFCQYFFNVKQVYSECVIGVQKHELANCPIGLNDKNAVLNLSKFITFPLTSDSLKITGILQFECIDSIAESDLFFLNIVSNLLALSMKHSQKQSSAQDQFEKVKKQVEVLEKERDLREQFVATLTHDLRTPLTSAKMSAQFILRRPEDSAKNQQLAFKIIKSINRMDQMLKDLLDVSRIGAGESLSFTMNYCDMREISISALRDLGVAYGDRFMLEVDRDTINGFWNEDGIRRVIENLASNAAKYGFAQQLITVSLKQMDDTVQIIVHNFGNPISSDDQKVLFQPFQRAKTAQNCGKKGWGLGLTLVRGVVEAHGGNVIVKSSEEEGTSFIVTIPKDARPFQILN